MSTYNEQLQSNNTDLQALIDKANTLPDLPNSVSQATPTITVSSSGLITALATQSEGFVSAGTKSATKQLSIQAAKTITPSTTSQTAVASGKYTTGAITVAGDANLTAANIAEGVSIFGITGTHSGGSGGGGNNLETCEVTVVQNWGMTDDPAFLHLWVISYLINEDGTISQTTATYLSSSEDLEPSHSTTFTAYIGIPFCIYAYGYMNYRVWTCTSNGGTITSTDVAYGSIFQCLPTDTTATLQFSIP